MSEINPIETPMEPERYELFSPSAYVFDLDRRDFFKLFGSGILLLSIVKPSALAQESGGGKRRSGDGMPQEIDAWLHLGENGIVTVYTGKVEVGQNIRTSLSQAVAEELRVPIERIELVMGDTQLTPFDMGTFGSRTTPTMNLQLRKVAAAARDILVNLAATQWQTDRAHLTAAGGKITDPSSHRSVEYAALVKGRQLTESIPAEDPLEPATSWKTLGQSTAKVDGRDFVTGEHRYPSDQKLTDMWYGKVLRPPSFGAILASADLDQAKQIGAVAVRDGNFLGVAAPTSGLANAALKALQADWKSVPQPSGKQLFELLRKSEGGEKDDDDRYEIGNVEDALKSSTQHLQQTYTIAYIAHVPLEPRAAVAKWEGDRLTVWTGTQRPFGVRGELAEAFRIPEDHVRVLMPDTGSGYGGKHTGETAIEAARLARAAQHPVKVVWTREEEFTWAYFRPAGVIDVSSAVRADGTISAWEFHNYNSGSAGIRTYYEIPNQRIVFHPVHSPLRQGSYRALAATANHFARESHMDELAHAMKMDPLEFRLKNLKNERLRAVFQAAVEKFGWSKRQSGPGRGFGMGGGYEKLGNVATFAEVHVDNKSGEVKVARVVSAFECGAIVNPDNLRNQVEGSNVQGLGGALFEAIEFENGRILNARMSQYRVPRFSDLPVMETVLVDRKDLPSAGAGECPMIGLAPAIANAIFDATGTRLRSLPLVPNGLKGA
jgi:nicotinate dehydrogenase subunit B